MTLKFPFRDSAGFHARWDESAAGFGCRLPKWLHAPGRF